MAGKQKGIRLSNKKEDCLTNLRFADDVLLFSTSLEKLSEMLCEFKTSTEVVGLGIHPNKTKILSNQGRKKEKKSQSTTSKSRSCQKGTVRDFLDKRLRSRSKTQKKSKNRLKAAWAAFHKYRQELTSKDYRLCHRLRLFSMVITPTLTYASETWTLSQKHERMIKTAQRKMLRFIVQTKRTYKSKERSSGQNSGGGEKVRRRRKQVRD